MRVVDSAVQGAVNADDGRQGGSVGDRFPRDPALGFAGRRGRGRCDRRLPDEPLDRAAMGAITASNPFAKLPSNFDGDHIVLQFTFLYNIR